MLRCHRCAFCSLNCVETFLPPVTLVAHARLAQMDEKIKRVRRGKKRQSAAKKSQRSPQGHIDKTAKAQETSMRGGTSWWMCPLILALSLGMVLGINSTAEIVATSFTMVRAIRNVGSSWCREGRTDSTSDTSRGVLTRGEPVLDRENKPLTPLHGTPSASSLPFPSLTTMSTAPLATTRLR